MTGDIGPINELYNYVDDGGFWISQFLLLIIMK